VQHVRRTRNEAAHTLAKLALSVREEEYWRLECPPSGPAQLLEALGETSKRDLIFLIFKY
jgi:hypothetical protein